MGFNSALGLIKTSPESNGKKIEIIWKVIDSKSRQVKVDDHVVFVQTKDEAKGSFIAPLCANGSFIAPLCAKGSTTAV